MSDCPAITLDVHPEKYSILVQTAAEKGLSLVGSAGSTSFQGLDFTWAYDEAAHKLTIQCTNKPIFVPCSMIESRIRALTV